MHGKSGAARTGQRSGGRAEAPCARSVTCTKGRARGQRSPPHAGSLMRAGVWHRDPSIKPGRIGKYVALSLHHLSKSRKCRQGYGGSSVGEPLVHRSEPLGRTREAHEVPESPVSANALPAWFGGAERTQLKESCQGPRSAGWEQANEPPSRK